MPICREFLDWQRPAPAVAADWLLKRYRRGRQVDMRRAVIVVPGRRAGRRLLEVLVSECAEQKLILNPPEITTEGSFPERLYTPKWPFANRLTQQAAWARAIAEAPEKLRRIIAPHLAADDTRRQWQLGDMLRKQHAELAADGLDFDKVATRGAGLADFDEGERWEAMATVQRRYLDILTGYKLWDVQSARLEAIKRKEPQTDGDIYLLGTVDLNIVIRDLLDLIESRVTALIFAPPDQAELFDSHGCLQPAAWSEIELPLREEQIVRADGPADQAAEAASLILKLKGSRRADEITVGVADESLVPQIQRQFHECGVTTRWVVGTPIPETAPFRFLTAAAEYVARREFAAFAALVRHPDVYAYLRGHEKSPVDTKFLTQLDEYFAAHLPLRIDGDWRGKDEEYQPLAGAAKLVDELLKDVLGGKGAATRLLGEWSDAIRATFKQLYTGRTFNVQQPAERTILDACESLEKVLQSFATVPLGLQPQLTFEQVLPLILEPLAAEAVPPPAMPEAVEILGWLELALDDAPVLIVTTFNEGFVPQSQTADAFLPNRLRQHLGLFDNHRRYARDAYSVRTILGSRPETSFIVGKRDGERNPLAPSRLLFAAPPEQVVARAQRFFQDLPSRPPRRVALSRIAAPPRSAFEVPDPIAPEKKLETINVTRFKSYLACKYRYYLQHVKRLQERDDQAAELAPGLFGDLVHDVLQDFSREDQLKNATDAEAIFAYLQDRLNSRVAGRFGTNFRRGAINLQREQIRSRLRAFSEMQARRASEGWQIAYTEDFEKQLSVPFAVDDGAVLLSGRIDRMDYHPGRNILQVLDYKTSDTAKAPLGVHQHKDGRWRDLQLPLYRHLSRGVALPNVDPQARIELGYIQLPKNVVGTELALAPWSEADLLSADEAARDVIRGIWDGIFAPRTDPPPEYSEAFAAICQDRLLDRTKPFIAQERDGDDA